MISAPQNNLRGEGNATQGNSAATSHALEDDLVHIGSTHLNMPNKERKCWHASLGGVQGNLPNTCGPKAAWVMQRAKGKKAQKSGLWNVNLLLPEGKSNKSSQEGRDWEAEPHMFTGVPVQYFANGMHWVPKAQMMI